MRKPGLFYKLETAVAAAEELSTDAGDRWAARRIRDEIVPALYEARTHVEVGQGMASEVRLALSRAAVVAGDLADANPVFAPLLSSLRRLQEDAAHAARPGRE
jgi:hypothetical protein